MTHYPSSSPSLDNRVPSWSPSVPISNCPPTPPSANGHCLPLQHIMSCPNFCISLSVNFALSSVFSSHTPLIHLSDFCLKKKRLMILILILLNLCSTAIKDFHDVICSLLLQPCLTTPVHRAPAEQNDKEQNTQSTPKSMPLLPLPLLPGMLWTVLISLPVKLSYWTGNSLRKRWVLFVSESASLNM